MISYEVELYFIQIDNFQTAQHKYADIIALLT